MRLIDADVLEPDADYDDGEYWAISMAQIQNAPTIEERKTGKWIEQDVVNRKELIETIKHYMQYPDGMSRLLEVYGGNDGEDDIKRDM